MFHVICYFLNLPEWLERLAALCTAALFIRFFASVTRRRADRGNP